MSQWNLEAIAAMPQTTEEDQVTVTQALALISQAGVELHSVAGREMLGKLCWYSADHFSSYERSPDRITYCFADNVDLTVDVLP